jgi:hypothetical protein
MDDEPMKTWKLLTLAAALVAAPAAFAEVTGVSGVVLDDKDRPIEGATVTLGARGSNEPTKATTDAKGEYTITVKGRGWKAGPGFLLSIFDPVRKMRLTRTLDLKDGVNRRVDVHLTPATAKAATAKKARPLGPISTYPVDNPGWYVTAGGGVIVVDRDSIGFGRTSDLPGENDVELDPSDSSPALAGTIGFRWNTNQSVQVSFFGASFDESKTVFANAFNVPVIDPTLQLAGPFGFGVNTAFRQEYEAEWRDVNLLYVHRFFDDRNWTLIARGGVAGGWFDQEFRARVDVDNMLMTDLKETVDDSYFGPQVGFEAQYRFCKRFWTTLGFDIGAMFGTAEMNARQSLDDLFGVVGPDGFRVKDSMDYTAFRLGAQAGVGWAPCRWASVQVGFHFGYWSEVPHIKNPSVTADPATGMLPYGPKARLATESLETGAVMGSVTLRFP